MRSIHNTSFYFLLFHWHQTFLVIMTKPGKGRVVTQSQFSPDLQALRQHRKGNEKTPSQQFEATTG